MGVLRSKVTLIVGVGIYLLMFHWTYKLIIATSFRYLGYKYYEVDGWGLFVAPFVLALFFASLMPAGLQKPSNVVVWVLFMMVFIPSLLVPSYARTLPASHLPRYWLMLSVGLVILLATSRLSSPAISGAPVNLEVFWATLVVIGVLLYAQVLRVFGFNFRLVSLSDVYEVRSAYKEALSGTSLLAAYAVSWLGNVINPLLISTGLVIRRRALSVLGFAGQLFLYSITGFKSVLFSSILLVGLLFLLRRPSSFGFRFVFGVNALIVMSVLMDRFTHQVVWTSLFVRRLLATPGLFTGHYVSFFSTHPQARLAYGRLAFLGDYPYSLTPPRLIGQTIFHSSTMSANANVWADGYANFGVLGLLGFSMVLGAVLWVYDGISNAKHPVLAVLMLAVPALSLANSGLFTSFLTHGILFGLLIMYILPYGSISKVSTGAGDTFLEDTTKDPPPKYGSYSARH